MSKLNYKTSKNREMQEQEEVVGLKSFIGVASTIAMPIIIQNLIHTLVGTADTIMLGYVSQDAMAASSLANQILTVLWMTLNGLITGGCVMAAQYWGKKDYHTIERVMGLAVRFSMIISIIFFAVVFFFPEMVMSLFINDANVITEGIRYLKIVGFSYLFMGFSQVYMSIQRSIERVILPSVTSTVSLVINVFINAVFIFGLFGLPKLGLVGVAIGTVTARFVEFIICAIHAICHETATFRIRYVFAKSGILMKDFLKLSFPSLINDVAWSLAFSTYSVILGRLGSDAVAANAVALVVLDIGAIVSRGFSNATTVIVGKELGQSKIHTAKVYARRMVWITVVCCIFGGAIIIGLRPLILSIYADKLSATAIKYLGAMLLMQSYHLMGEGLNTCWICGCFRGGGDAKFGMIVDTIMMWGVAVPVMAIAAFVLKLPVEWVYFAMCLDEFEKMLPTYIHYKKFNWLKNITRDEAELAV